MPRHTPAAASRTSPVRSPGGEAPFAESLSSGACVGLYDEHKSRGQRRRGSSHADYGYRLGAEETLDVDRWRLRLSSIRERGSRLDLARNAGRLRRFDGVLLLALQGEARSPNRAGGIMLSCGTSGMRV